MTDEHQAALARAFDAGTSYAEFKRGLGPDAIRFAEVDADIATAPAASPFRGLGPLRILALAEGWCRDSADSLPVLARLVADVPGVELRVIHRDAHMELMRWYLSDGNATIPVYVFMDDQGRELARYIERPAAVSAIRRAERARLAREDSRFAPPSAPPKTFPEPVKTELKAAINRLRAESRPMVTELIELTFAEIAEAIQEERRTGSVPEAAAMAPALSIVDVGDDECRLD